MSYRHCEVLHSASFFTFGILSAMPYCNVTKYMWTITEEYVNLFCLIVKFTTFIETSILASQIEKKNNFHIAGPICTMLYQIGLFLCHFNDK